MGDPTSRTTGRGARAKGQVPFQVILCSPTDDDGLVSEVWAGDELIAEVRADDGGPSITLLGRPGGRFDLEQFTSSLAEAAGRLRS